MTIQPYVLLERADTDKTKLIVSADANTIKAQQPTQDVKKMPPPPLPLQNDPVQPLAQTQKTKRNVLPDPVPRGVKRKTMKQVACPSTEPSILKRRGVLGEENLFGQE